MRTKRTSNNVRPVELPPLFHRGTRTPNIERRHDGLNFIFDVGSSEFDVRCFRSSRPSSRVTRHSQKGVALVITLILLSVVTFMAITFLALSRRERSAVSTVTDTASARLAADAALANAEAQVVANVLATTNPYNFTLLVSTNYINANGFVSGSASPTNVNYGHLFNSSTLLSPADFLQNLENLYYSPRPPVFIANSTNSSLPPDFRYYLDLNRNGRYDTNGWVTNVDNNLNGLGTTKFQVGDPEWIGVLERPDAPYGPNNKFIARYAFIAVPVGNTLDLNAIHNQAFDPVGNRVLNPPPAGDIFLRNQGVGSWEINLAAFLADLNMNEWDPPTVENSANDPYTYRQWQQPNQQNLGRAFDDARALLAYRYNNNYGTLAPVGGVNGLYPASTAAFRNNIDGYSDGPLMITLSGTNDYFQDVTLPWAGADNTNHFFTHQELFDPTKTQTGVISPTLGFSDHLKQASTNVSTYDRYTFYRLLSQLGTDSAPDSGKMNLNYQNVDTNGNVVPNMETNFISWTNALQFFTNAADRLLRAYTTQWRNSNPTNFATTFYSVTDFSPMFFNQSLWTNYPAFGITNIPVLVSNQFVYSPAVNRLLQLAANIYDATTNSFYPSVFRPIFEHDNFGNVFIVGYTSLYSSYGPNTVSGTSDRQLAMPYDVTQLFGLLTANFTPIIDANGYYVNVYGVPWIIGAKKGFPNFNELAMQNAFQLTRKLQVTRTSPSALPNTYSYNQMLILSITNQLGVECWNSYTNSYTNQVTIYAVDYLKNIMLTNTDEHFGSSTNFIVSGFIQIPNPTNSVWSGYNFNTPNPSFQIPLFQSVTVTTNSMYRFNGGSPYLTTDLNLPYETNVGNYPQPHWWLMVTNDLRVIMLDGTSSPYHIIDYVQLSGPNSVRDLASEIAGEYDTGSPSADQGDDLWDTNRNNQGVPYGYANQVGVSLGLYTAGAASGTWNQTDPTLLQNEIDGFRAYYHLSLLHPSNPGESQTVALAQATNDFQAPYTPTATAFQHVTWQANDPLVHYIASDLQGAPGNTNNRNFNWPANLGQLNDRYMPWGGNPNLPSADQNPYNFAIKDPLVSSSDYWNFPANKFPTVGWLGRVHRGTPWQTVYLKATNLLDQIQIIGTPPIATTNYIGRNTWMTWTGNGNSLDATKTAPAQDRLLFDLFTTAFNDNATRGTLSVNVGPTNANLAAWSALFSGIIVPTSLTNTTVINPAGPAGAPVPVGPPPSPNSLLCLGYLVQNGTNGINDIRAQMPGGVFTHVGDILSVPALTDKSPFLSGLNSANGINDEMYEWLPQQTMSLLRVSGSPRYVIYCYGQALKPAPNSIYTGGGQFFGMVTNYQVVSEIATRAVVRFASSVTNNVVPVFTNGFFTGNFVSQAVVTNNNAVIERFNILPPD
jgi:hypothetical protein